jgi:CTP:phosphocholine cytidylyltransferase-like protein/thiamine kinase-like enzyme
MNLQEADILRTLLEKPYVNQRILSDTTGHSLGVINRSLKNLTEEGYLTSKVQLTKKAKEEIKNKSPRNAIILAAGFGMRMVPINLSTPKALIEIDGEVLIERIIRQLHDKGIKDITVVVGFMKESFEYLIDEFGVDLIVNSEYANKNNLHSLALAKDRISNTYIVPCDIWCRDNPFSSTELYSWYMVSDEEDEESTVRVNRKTELVKVSDKEPGNRMIGISYIMKDEAEVIAERLNSMDDNDHAGCFWEETLISKDRMILPARIVPSNEAVEINTYEQLREIDSDSNHLKSDAMHTITKVLNCREKDITDISVLKKGMTNRSFIFSVKGNKYIMRIPGEGTEKLINRKQEAEVFATISGKGLCDDPVYIDPKTGFKITKYLEGIRTCDPENEEDLKKCMRKLKAFHDMKLKVPHAFDIFGQIDFYEKLWDGTPSVYRDYKKTKANVLSLKPFIDNAKKTMCLTHIDAVPDNFLFYKKGRKEELQLTDWEYSGMQDPHVDIAMFCIYSLYDKEQCDRLIDIYFDGACENDTRTKIYCYIAICGLLWSNWCEYKRKFGVEFGEYSLRQYRYAKDFFTYAEKLMGEAQ